MDQIFVVDLIFSDHFDYFVGKAILKMEYNYFPYSVETFPSNFVMTDRDLFLAVLNIIDNSSFGETNMASWGTLLDSSHHTSGFEIFVVAVAVTAAFVEEFPLVAFEAYNSYLAEAFVEFFLFQNYLVA